MAGRAQSGARHGVYEQTWPRQGGLSVAHAAFPHSVLRGSESAGLQPCGARGGPRLNDAGLESFAAPGCRDPASRPRHEVAPLKETGESGSPHGDRDSSASSRPRRHEGTGGGPTPSESSNLSRIAKCRTAPAGSEIVILNYQPERTTLKGATQASAVESPARSLSRGSSRQVVHRGLVADDGQGGMSVDAALRRRTISVP